MRTRNIYLLAISMWIGLSGLGVHAQAVHITEDRGGKIHEYVASYQAIKSAGRPVIIDGRCLSACTLVLGIVPRNRICTTARGSFGFHEAWVPVEGGGSARSESGTYALMWHYPADVHAWIKKTGGLRKNLRMTKAAQFVRACSKEQLAEIRAGAHR